MPCQAPSPGCTRSRRRRPGRSSTRGRQHDGWRRGREEGQRWGRHGVAASSGRKPADADAEKKLEALRGVAACAMAKSGDASARAHDGCTRRRRAAADGGRCTSTWSRSMVPSGALMARSIASRCSRMARKGAAACMAAKEAGAAARMAGMEAAARAGADAARLVSEDGIAIGRWGWTQSDGRDSGGGTVVPGLHYRVRYETSKLRRKIVHLYLLELGHRIGYFPHFVVRSKPPQTQRTD
jgi:hypothetical protein